MKAEIKLIVKRINKLLKEEKPTNDWLKGRLSAFRGVKSQLERVLNEATVERSELIDFINWANDNSFIRVTANEDYIVDEYEKSINATKRN